METLLIHQVHVATRATEEDVIILREINKMATYIQIFHRILKQFLKQFPSVFKNLTLNLYNNLMDTVCLASILVCLH